MENMKLQEQWETVKKKCSDLQVDISSLQKRLFEGESNLKILENEVGVDERSCLI
jgi:peptidoglycan hydrolase CwlO-like protein